MCRECGRLFVAIQLYALNKRRWIDRAKGTGRRHNHSPLSLTSRHTVTQSLRPCELLLYVNVAASMRLHYYSASRGSAWWRRLNSLLNFKTTLVESQGRPRVPSAAGAAAGAPGSGDTSAPFLGSRLELFSGAAASLPLPAY
eukprot:COSAG06_NODE_6052_length_3134_cov_15.537068_4_plen_142_part_00